MAVGLAAVSSVAGITVAQRGTDDSGRLMRVPVGAEGTDTGTASGGDQAAFTAAGSKVATNAAPSAGPPARVVAPLGRRVDPDLFLIAGRPLTPAQVAAVRRATGATGALRVDGARVRLGSGTTTAVGVDPSSFRTYAPDNTAQVDALWQRIAAGDVAVAHAVAQAIDVQLGGRVGLGRERPQPARVGAFATTRLAGVGVVVDRKRSAEFGLVPGAALILTIPAATDPVAAAAAARRAVPGAEVAALRPPAGATGVGADGGVSVQRGGWTLPLRAGTFTLSQRFGVRNGRDANGHPGIDLAAPLGTPMYAAGSGSVLYSGPAQGFGNWIVLQHPGGVQTVYGHMRGQDLLIPPGAQAAAGQNIARVGSEGLSTGPHLHFEVRVDNQRVDPVAFLSANQAAPLN